MKSIKFFCLTILFLSSCKPEGIKNSSNKTDEFPIKNKISKAKQQKELKKMSLAPLDEIGKLELEDGIKITYFIDGSGDKFKDGEVAEINYEVLLKDKTLVDGNKLLNRESLPFMVGYGMQTPGWDLVFKELKVGDFVEVFLPSKMARGKNGIKGLIPPNSDNILHIKVISKLKPTRNIDGTKVWVLEQNKLNKKTATEDSEIDFHYIVGTKSHPHYDISYRRNQPYNFKFSDFGIVKGLKKALINVKKADKLWILIPPSEAYGNKGLNVLVKPNESIFYDIFILDVR